jgi:hypothetical protein
MMQIETITPEKFRQVEDRANGLELELNTRAR